MFPLLTCTQMSVELDVFVGNTTIMDEEVYQLWLDGYTGVSGTHSCFISTHSGKNTSLLSMKTMKGKHFKHDLTSCLQNCIECHWWFVVDCLSVNDAVKVRMEGGVMEECEASADVLLSDTMDQYRTFQMCERLLYSPAKLGNQLLFQIPPHLQAILIER